MLQAMNTGHDGSLSTVHANSPRDALARVETMVLMAGFDLPVRAIRAAGLVGARPDRPPRAARGRLAPRHHDHRGAADGVGRDHAAGHLRVQDRVDRAPTARSSVALQPTGLRPDASCRSSRSTGSSSPQTSSPPQTGVEPFDEAASLLPRPSPRCSRSARVPRSQPRPLLQRRPRSSRRRRRRAFRTGRTSFRSRRRRT